MRDQAGPVASGDSHQYCTQSNYEHFLAHLEAHEVNPGTVIIDSKWQAFYGDPYPDRGKWPDLRDFVEKQHRKGCRVLLWICPWVSEGVPVEECITGPGLGVQPDGPGQVRDRFGKDPWKTINDPTNPTYQERLQRAIHRLLSPEEGGANVDGFKVDYSSISPMPPGMQVHGKIWGIELVRQAHANIYQAAKEAKSDALVETQCCTPYFRDVCDMLRLNDMFPTGLNSQVPIMRMRGKVAHLTNPGWLIDTDNLPMPSRTRWREYTQAQPSVGLPALYYAESITPREEDAFTEEDYALLRWVWSAWRKERKKRAMSMRSVRGEIG